MPKHLEANYIPLGSALYYSLRHTTGKLRQAIISIHAFYQALSGIKLKTSELSIAQRKIDWWREELEQAQHPITQSMLTSNLFQFIHQQQLHNIINAIESDLYVHYYNDESQLMSFLQQSRGEITCIISQIMQQFSEQSSTLFRQLGAALQLADSLIRLRYYLDHDNDYLIDLKLQAHQVTRTMLQHYQLTTSTQAAIKDHMEYAKQNLDYAFNKLQYLKIDKHFPDLILARLQLTLLKEIAQENYDILSKKIRLTPIRMWCLSGFVY